MDFIKIISENRKMPVICLSVLFIIVGFFCFQYFTKTTVEEFTMSGKVLSVDASKNFLILKPMGKETEVKVLLSPTTQLINLEAPFPQNNPPPPGTQFTPIKTGITINDFRQGDEVLVKSSNNLSGKKKIDHVEFVQILP